MDNFRAALTWAKESGNVEVWLELLGYLCGFWTQFDPSEGRQWCESALASGKGGDGPRGLASVTLAFTHYVDGDSESAIAAFEEAERLFQRAGDSLRAARSRLEIGWVLFYGKGSAAAEPCFQQALETFRGEGALTEAAQCLRGLSWCISHSAPDSFNESIRLSEEAEALLIQAGNKSRLADHYGIFANLIEWKFPERAEESRRRCIEIAKEVGDATLVLWPIRQRAIADLESWRIDDARRGFEELRSIAAESDQWFHEAAALWGLARIENWIGSAARAEALLEDALALFSGRPSGGLTRYSKMDIVMLLCDLARRRGDIETVRRLLLGNLSRPGMQSIQWGHQANLLLSLSELERDLGNQEKAVAYAEQSREATWLVDDYTPASLAMRDSHILRRQGRNDESTALIEAALEAATPDSVDHADLLWNKAQSQLDAGDYVEARRSFEAFQSSPHPKYWSIPVNVAINCLRGCLVEGDFEAADAYIQQVGWKWRVQALAGARCSLLETIAFRAVLSGDAALAAEMLGASAAYRDLTKSPAHEANGPFIERVTALVKEHIDQTAFDAAAARGVGRHEELLDQVFGTYGG